MYSILVNIPSPGGKLNCVLLSSSEGTDSLTRTTSVHGISVMNALSKLYDMVLCDRLNQWLEPCREQAGAQSKRGCLEHIVTLRLPTETARRKKFKLFVMFVDFSKAYDLVPRDILFEVMKRLGCGRAMLAVLKAMYQRTQCVIGEAVMTATLGVRQGAPTLLMYLVYSICK